METPSVIASHLRNVYNGGNWTDVNIKDTLADVSWQEATTKIGDCNTIAALTYHIDYFVKVIIPVLEGGQLDAHDKYSYDHPPITDEETWTSLKDRIFRHTEQAAGIIEGFTEAEIDQHMADPKYGSWWKNLFGTIEHCHYHLGQIVILKKLIRAQGV